MAIVNNSHWHRRIAKVAGIAIATACLASCKSSASHPDEKIVLATQDEVYATVVREMITPADGRLQIKQLVFGDELVSERENGTAPETCKEKVRKQQHWNFDALPYDTLLDKSYRLLTHGWTNTSAATETVEDFLTKICTSGNVSRTFSTDLPRNFVKAESIHFEVLAIGENGASSFEKLFPGANGVISFSRVGFDSGLDEAMVSVGFVCGALCGEGWYYILKKRKGGWEVANKRMIWVS